MLRRHFINVSYSKDIKPNEIWYKTSNGEKFEYNILMNALGGLSLPLLKENHLIHDDWWCLTFTNNITYTGINESEIGPSFIGLLDIFGQIETNIFNIIEIKLPSIFFIGDLSFYGCKGLQYITIPNSVTSIGDMAFWSCENLTSVTIPNSVTSIGEKAFKDCSKLTKTNYTGDIAGWCNIIFGDNYANPMYCSHNFYINDQEIKDLVIPNSVTSIGEWTFGYCPNLTSIVVEAGNSTYDSRDNSNAIIETTTNTLIVGCQNTIIPNSVTRIGGGAFKGCSSLTSITCKAETPPTIEGQSTFDGVSKSIPVYVPCGCVEAYKAASGWSDFTNIQEPLVEYSIEVYANDTLMGTAQVNYNTYCKGAQISATPNNGCYFLQWSDGNTDNPRILELTQDTVLTAEFAHSLSGQCGDSLYWELVDTTLHITGSGEMYYYTSDTAPWKLLGSSIETLIVAEGVTQFNQAFNSCSALESIVWNARHAEYDDAQYIPNPLNMFYAIRSQIKSFTFGDSVQHIPEYLCYGMSKLNSVIIPNSVTSIGLLAFRNCSSLPVENNLRYADTYLVEAVDKTLSTCSIKEGTKWLGNKAFSGCSSLSSIVIPNGVTSIGGSAFMDCSSLTSIVLPDSLQSIGNGAFWLCSSLTSITFNGTKDQWGSVEFDDGWNFAIPATVVHCTDGDVAIQLT